MQGWAKVKGLQGGVVGIGCEHGWVAGVELIGWLVGWLVGWLQRVGSDGQLDF